MKRKDINLLLGSDLAQHDKNYLTYAIPRDDLLSDLKDPNNSLLIVNAPRGSGKSGLLLSLENSIATKRNDCVIIKKYYEDVDLPDAIEALNKHVCFWKNTILGWVVSEVGKNMGVALTDDEMTAVEHAEDQGEKEKNLVSSVLSRLKINALPLSKLEYDATLREATVRRILRSSSNEYWLLLDEMDDIYSNSIGRNHSLVALFQAANFLVGKYDNLKIRITIRPHIFTHLITNFDSVQKLRECVLPLAWTDDQLKNILAERVRYYDNVASKDVQVEKSRDEGESCVSSESDIELISRYFDDFDMTFSKGRGSSYRAFHTASLERPRWMIELCKLALAQNPDEKKATTNCFKLAFADYGQNRVDFISGEYKEMYPQLSAIINSIAGCRRLKIGDSKKLRSLIRVNVLDKGIIAKPEGSTDEEQGQLALAIAKSLYVVEFIRARQNSGGRGKDHRHYTYNTRPGLLDSWTNEKNIAWEIHPTFARALNIVESQVYKAGGETRGFKNTK